MKLIKYLLIIFSIILLFSCSDETPIIKSIDVIDIPKAIEVGKFDDAGIRLEIKYSDGDIVYRKVTEKIIPDEYTHYLYEDGTHNFHFMYLGFKLEFEITMYTKVYKVTFINNLNQIVAVKEGNSLIGVVCPTEEEMYVEGYRFLGTYDHDLETIESDITVKGQYIKVWTVEFYNNLGQLISSQIIDNGNSASVPNDYYLEGYTFIKWDKSFDKITSDLKVYGIYEKENEHTYSEVIISPTCHTQGYTIYQCECGYSYIGSYVGPAPHKFEIIEHVDPTCIKTGYNLHQCTECNIYKQEIINAVGHNLVIAEKVDSTCTENGHIHYVCTNDDCSYEKVKTVLFTGHNFDINNICIKCGFEPKIHEHIFTETIVEPTCTEMGYTLYSCECGYSFANNIIEPKMHSWDDGTIVIEPTCTIKGLIVYSCVDCDETMEYHLELKHEFIEEIIISATCYTDGLMSKTCSLCGMKEDEIIPAGHIFSHEEIIQEPTCTKNGIKKCYCTVCEEYIEVEIKSKGHELYNGICKICGAEIDDLIENTGSSLEYGMYIKLEDTVSNYGPELINEYGVYLDHNEDAIIEKVAVYLVQKGNYWVRAIAVVGENIRYATYVPYLSYDNDYKYTGLNSNYINTFSLSENSDGIWCYNNYTTIWANLADSKGNLLINVFSIAESGSKTRIFTNLNEMIKWLKECNDHKESDWIIGSESTCNTEGYKYTQCTRCKEVLNTKTIPIVDHIYVEQILNPTCTEVGYTKHQCKWCEDVDDITYIDALGHNIVVDKAVAVTCTTDGLTEGEHCTRCNYKVQQEIIPALGHDLTIDEAVEATCTTAGLTEGRHCKNCDYDEKQVVIPALGHNIIIDKGVNPTCITDGLTQGEHCARCEYKVEQEIIPALGHNIVFDKGVNPTCTTDGLTEGEHCTRCDYKVKQEVILHTGHNLIIDYGKEATCTEPGLTDGKHCTKCDYDEKQEIIPAKGHKYNSVVTPPACLTTGYTTHTCECGTWYIDNYTTPLQHNIVSDKGYEPTCTAAGLSDGEHCTRCDYEIKQNVIEATGHSYISYHTQPTCTTQGYTTDICHCGHTVKHSYVNALGHNIVIDEKIEATCTTTGLTQGEHCTRCSYQIRQQVIPATGHTHETVVTPPTCIDEGYTTHTCHCGDTYVDSFVDALGHDIVIDEKVEPTCTKTGLTEGSHCDRCNEVFVKQNIISIDPNKHDYEGYVCKECNYVNYTKGLSYESDGNGGYILTGIGTATDTELVIPSYIGGYPVVKVGFNAFKYCTALKSVYIPSTVEYIENGAFESCENLESVVISNGVKYISSYAFALCSKLTMIEIPYTVEVIESDAFYLCEKLEFINVSSKNDYLKSIEGVLFSKDGLSIIQYPIGKKLEQYVIPNEVKYIGDSSFRFSLVNEIIIPDGVISIGDYAFGACVFSNIELPTSITTIGEAAFFGCINLQNITLPSLVNVIEDNTFENCDSLVSVLLPNNLITIGERAFQYCNTLENISIPSGVKEIGYYAFAGCNNLINIYIPDSVINIGEGAFSSCTSLVNVIIPNSVLNLGAYAFSSCTQLKNVNLSNKITTIDGTFNNCSNLEKVELPFGIEYIGDYSFNNCINLKSINIPNSVKSIGECAFLSCRSLTNIIIPNSVVFLDEVVFLDCGELMIYCETESQPTGWNCYWNPENYTVIWDYLNNHDCIFDSKLCVICGKHSPTEGLEYEWNESELSYTVIGLGTSTDVDIIIPSIYNGYPVTKIGFAAICSSYIESVELSNSITMVDCMGISNCSNLKYIKISKSLQSHGPDAFYGNNSLIEFIVDDKNKYYCAIDGNLYTKDNIDSPNVLVQYALGKNDKIFIMPETVNGINSSSFLGESDLEIITLSENVSFIDYYAFSNCVNLKSIIIPCSVMYIDFGVFHGCTNLTIYCEFPSQPDSWSCDWNNYNCPVIWGYGVEIKEGIYLNIEGVTSSFDDSYKLQEENGIYSLYFKGEYGQVASFDSSIDLTNYTITNESFNYINVIDDGKYRLSSEVYVFKINTNNETIEFNYGGSSEFYYFPGSISNGKNVLEYYNTYETTILMSFHNTGNTIYKFKDINFTVELNGVIYYLDEFVSQEFYNDYVPTDAPAIVEIYLSDYLPNLQGHVKITMGGLVEGVIDGMINVMQY